ncbi:MAG TPA: hypothetical protein VHW90_12085, partial [Stellaceae bacterium]|nr:hypothetical protein [Stellaceae bacterium]
MRQMLSGVAIAAVMAIASPVWAQAPMSPSTPLNPQSAAPKAAATTPAAARPARPHRMMRSVSQARYYRNGNQSEPWSDGVADQLNGEELNRVAMDQGPAMAPGPGAMPMQQNMNMAAPGGYPPPG